MKIGITGIRGFVGTQVAKLAKERGHEVVGFSRKGGNGLREFSLTRPPDVGGLDAVVNLAGESILGLWTEEKKRRILESRMLGTLRVVEAMAKAPNGPQVLVNASAVGYYGATEDVADESAPAGEGFLADVCRQWETEAQAAVSRGARVTFLRIGLVLGHGGAMKLIKPVFSLGIGGNIGNGKQWMSGVHVDDVAGLALHAVENANVEGPLNAVMPEPFRNEEFTKTLGKILHRPVIFPVPAPILKLVAGEASQLLLDDTRVVPARTLESGYVFKYPTLESALREALS